MIVDLRVLKDFARFLRTSRGSLYELETQVLLSQRVGVLNPNGTQTLLMLLDECSRVLNGLLATLKTTDDSDP